MNHIFKNALLGLLVFSMTTVFSGCSAVSPSEETKTASVVTEETQTVPDTKEDTKEVIDKTSYPLTLENYSIADGVWQSAAQTFEKAPERIVANTQPTAELLIHLGLTDKIVGVGAVYGESTADIADEFAKIPVLSKDYVGKELVLGANPDLVMGRWDLFADADWGVGTVEELNGMGIHTFIQNTCRQDATLEDLYKDIEQLGQLFGVQENATEFSDSLRTRTEQLKGSLADVKDTLKYAYVSSVADGSVSIYSGSTDTFQNDVLNLIKLDNAFKDVIGEINLEQFIATDPDVLLISYYSGGPDTAKMIEDLYVVPSLQNLKAIKNKQIYAIDFNQFWGYGYQILDGVEKLASEVYPDLVILK